MAADEYSLQVSVAAVQLQMGHDEAKNLERARQAVREAAGRGAKVIVLPELFAGPYFCTEQVESSLAIAKPVFEHPWLWTFSQLAGELGVVLPVSFYERDGPHLYNSVAVYDADGTCLGIYRKSHVPDGPGYQEKYYFRPSRDGFKVWPTRYGVLGVGICWDQWFPECARAMALQGADVLLYPTAIGSEPNAPDTHTFSLWQRAMVGHAVCNATPVVAANRIGQEKLVTFYGKSFICDERGDICSQLPEAEEGIAVSLLDIKRATQARLEFGFFRDRRPELYKILAEL